MKEIDLKLKLFTGRAINVTGYGDIAPLTVREIIDKGYSEYMRCLNIMTLEAKDFMENPPDDLHILELLIIYGGHEIESAFEEALALFLRGKIVIDKEDCQVYVKVNESEINIINKENYQNIQDVIKWQNYINNFEEKSLDKFDPADEETRKLKEQMDAVARRRDELKKRQNQNDREDDENNIDFFDILSAISSKSYGINELNVSDLTVYQVYRKFKRMEVIDQYDISIKSILAGAKDVKLRHWSSKT